MAATEIKINTQATITRLDKIEALLSKHYRVYNHAARHSNAHTKAFYAISSLESERSMLDAMLQASKRHI